VSLRLRILLWITAVNIAVLLLVVQLGLRVVQTEDPIGTPAVLEGLQVAAAERPLDIPWHHVEFMVRRKAGASDVERFAPPELDEEVSEAERRLLERLEERKAGYWPEPGGLLAVRREGAEDWAGFYVGFRERANPVAIENLRSIYVLLCGGTLALTVVIYLVLNRMVLRPLEDLAHASRAVGEGLPPTPVRRPRGEHEVAHLVDSFNRMSREVYEYKEHLEDRVLRALERVKSAESRLVVAQRLASTGTLAAGFAHEINNPLGGILNALRKLRGGNLGEERREEYFEIILDGLHRIRTIVERMLNFTPRRREPADVDVREACRRALALAAHRAEKRRVALEIDAPQEVGGVVGDDQELTQAVLNLVLNAVDSVPEERKDGRIVVRCSKERARATIEVEDNGRGMDEETRRRCVDFFFSTKPEGEGTGLGLAIVQHIVTDHGGTLDIDSAEGRGTRVVIRLPLEEPV